MICLTFRSQSYQIATAFEVHVRTQSLCTADEDASAAGPSSHSSSSSSTVTNETAAAAAALTQSSLSQQSLWTTKEAGACVITALLLRLQLVN